VIAKKLPSLLDLMIAKARLEGTPDPLYECKMGWCTQCSCNKEDIQNTFGKVHYRTEPTMPPVAEKLLPCISTQTKYGIAMDDVRSLYTGHNVQVIKLSTVLARMPAEEEVGGVLKSLVALNGKIVVGNRVDITCSTVIVRNPRPIGNNKFTDMAIASDKFLKSYDRLPGTTFEVFNTSKPVNGFSVTEAVYAAWPRDDDGKAYYVSGRDIYEVGVGSIITTNGNALTEELLARVKIVHLDVAHANQNNFTSLSASL
jgi:hypothetical protein